MVVRPAVDRRKSTTDFKSAAEVEMIGGWMGGREKKSMPMESRYNIFSWKLASWGGDREGISGGLGGFGGREMEVLVEEMAGKWRFLWREREGKLGVLEGNLLGLGRELVVVTAAVAVAVVREKWRVYCMLVGISTCLDGEKCFPPGLSCTYCNAWSVLIISSTLQ